MKKICVSCRRTVRQLGCSLICRMHGEYVDGLGDVFMCTKCRDAGKLDELRKRYNPKRKRKKNRE